MTTEVVAYQSPDMPALSAEQVRARVNLVQQVMKGVMKPGTHYGRIPGAGDKPTLLKPGAETLAMTFQIAVEPIVEDLSTSDEAHFRVVCRATSQATGTYLGSGIGEASSNEEKYKWRAAVCKEEFEEAAEDRRRMKWKKGYQGAAATQIMQVRTNHADVANTVLKMAKKRSQVDMTLTVTGASDMFTQDIEDLPDELRTTIAEDETQAVSPPIGAAALKSLQDEMARVGLNEDQIKRNLALKAKYEGELADMPVSVWEPLMAGLAQMPDKKQAEEASPAPHSDAPASQGAVAPADTTDAVDEDSGEILEGEEIPGMDAEEFKASAPTAVEAGQQAMDAALGKGAVPRTITGAQIKLLYSQCGVHGVSNASEDGGDQLHAHIAETYAVGHVDEIPADSFDEVLAWVKGHKKGGTA